jgi:hypothetical protein
MQRLDQLVLKSELMEVKDEPVEELKEDLRELRSVRAKLISPKHLMFTDKTPLKQSRLQHRPTVRLTPIMEDLAELRLSSTKKTNEVDYMVGNDSPSVKT